MQLDDRRHARDKLSIAVKKSAKIGSRHAADAIPPEDQKLNASNQRDFHDNTRSLTSLPLARQQPAGRTIASDQLFAGEREIGIEHRGALYRLKITRQGKLILNK